MIRRWDRIVLMAGLIALAPVLAGCESFDFDKLDVFNLNQKKKLPGERHPVFPGGVPGVTQGVPPEYLKGNQPPPETADVLPPQQANPQAAAAPSAATGERPNRTAAVEPLQTSPRVQTEPKPKAKPGPKPKAKAKPKPKPKPKSEPATAASQPQQQQPTVAPWPGTAPAQQQPAQTAPWPGTQNTATAPWPAAPPPGTFSR